MCARQIKAWIEVSKVAGRPIESVSQYILVVKNQWSACTREERGKREERREGVGRGRKMCWLWLIHGTMEYILRMREFIKVI